MVGFPGRRRQELSPYPRASCVDSGYMFMVSLRWARRGNLDISAEPFIPGSHLYSCSSGPAVTSWCLRLRSTGKLDSVCAWFLHNKCPRAPRAWQAPSRA